MSDKKEIATLSIKISVDSTDLDKLEAQLKRINDLLVSTGMKKPASGGFIADTFGVFKCQGGGVFIPEPCIGAASIRRLSELMNDKAKEAVKEIAKQSPTTTMTITTGVNNNCEHFKQQIESNYNDTRLQLESIRDETAQSISGLQHQIAQLTNELEEARLKGSVNAISIINLKQAIEQQEKSMTQAIKQTIVEDMARGGPLCRILR
ncbi:hypothetical protein [Moellerella wisconsensis]|uniref:hypothetical protein n=1 Tax=Moellerella wisconsensis TaxID=158849 RepID=UPI001F4D597D|nr:hypothetical protein [Moellerella wisconsensis]UNH23114.1 hypothetical protein MNY68_09640 [Moellerella wisconsensis]